MIDKFEIGEIVNLKVKRKSDIGYVLVDIDDEIDIFLHQKQVIRPIEEGEVIPVFLYFDNKKRLAATMETPIITVKNPGIVRVVSVNSHLGVFVSLNIVKDILISKDDMPKDPTLWPQVGDEVYVKLKNTKTQLIGKLVNGKTAPTLLKPRSTRLLVKDEMVEATVLKAGKEGLNLIDEDHNNIFVYHKFVRDQHHIGEKLTVRIIKCRFQNEYNGTLLPDLMQSMSEDGNRIIKYLEDHDGEMPYTAKTDSEVIGEVFKMSKAAFKRALGSLYKAKAVNCSNERTKLIK